jgi:hypothetical protein
MCTTLGAARAVATLSDWRSLGGTLAILHDAIVGALRAAEPAELLSPRIARERDRAARVFPQPREPLRDCCAQDHRPQRLVQ